MIHKFNKIFEWRSRLNYIGIHTHCTRTSLTMDWIFSEYWHYCVRRVANEWTKAILYSFGCCVAIRLAIWRFSYLIVRPDESPIRCHHHRNTQCDFSEIEENWIDENSGYVNVNIICIIIICELFYFDIRVQPINIFGTKNLKMLNNGRRVVPCVCITTNRWI